MKTLIKNAKIVTINEVKENCFLTFTDNIIDYIGNEERPADNIMDGHGMYLIPGFIDLHCHGGNGYEFMDSDNDGIKKITDFHLAHGTTTMLATTLTADDKETHSTLENIKKYKNKRPKSTIRGVHLEGPWLNMDECGAQNSKYLKKPDVAELTALKADYPFILRISSAPELENGMNFGQKGVELGIVMSIAHTVASWKDVENAKDNGYTLITHLYSGMRTMWRKNSYRIAGAVEAGLYFDDLYVEIIADGRHLPCELLKLIYKCKGMDKICLITDAIRAAGMENGERTVIGSKANGLNVIVEDDVAKLPDRQSFAGSCATFDRLYKTMAFAMGKDFVALSRMSSANPARVMGWNDIGEIAVGKKADMLFIDDNLNINGIITDRED